MRVWKKDEGEEGTWETENERKEQQEKLQKSEEENIIRKRKIRDKREGNSNKKSIDGERIKYEK
jgi:hypothetical protein